MKSEKKKEKKHFLLFCKRILISEWVKCGRKNANGFFAGDAIGFQICWRMFFRANVSWQHFMCFLGLNNSHYFDDENHFKMLKSSKLNLTIVDSLWQLRCVAAVAVLLLLSIRCSSFESFSLSLYPPLSL